MIDKPYCDQHSGNTACILGLKNDLSEIKARIVGLTEANLKLGERLTTTIENCLVCAESWKTTYTGKLDNKMNTSLFTWLFAGIGVLGMFIIATLSVQLGMMYKLDAKVEMSIVQQTGMRSEIHAIKENVSRLELKWRNEDYRLRGDK